MEELESNNSQASLLESAGLMIADCIPFISTRSNKADVLKGEPSEEAKLSEIDTSYNRLAILQICRGCLCRNDVTNMKDTSIGGVPITDLYQDISKIKVKMEGIPLMICKECVAQLENIDKFVKTLKHSHGVLERVTKEIQKLDTKENDESFNFIINNMLKNEMYVNWKEENSGDGDLHMKEVDEHNDKAMDQDSFSVPHTEESSDDEIPLSERFKLYLTKETIKPKENSSEKKAPPKKRGRRKKEHNENVPENKSTNKKQKEPDKLQISEILSPQNPECPFPLCSKKFRHFSKHLQSVHSLDWEKSMCLKCLYENSDVPALVAHCTECTKIELKTEDTDLMDSGECKVEWYDTMDDACDPDFDDYEEDEDDEFIEEDGSLEKEEQSSGNHPKGRKRKNKNFSCNKCPKETFKGYEEIEEHFKTVHGSEMNCILCEDQFNNNFSLIYHMMVKHGKRKCCRLCLVSFDSSDELSKHYKSEEHNTKCTVCGEQFKNRKMLYEHRRKKHLNPQLENLKYKCPQCPREFSNPSNIKRHIMVTHNDLRFLCDTCGQSYTTKRNLKLHIQKFHEGLQVENKNTKKNFFCEACGRELRIFHKYAIAMHRAKHKGHNFVCKKCYDSFPTEESFKKHVDESGHHLFECDKCQAEFVREENLKSHLKNHDAPGWNKNMFATWGKSAKLRNEKGEFVCSYCPKVFKDKQRLDNHVRVHTNERPYKCHICSKGFKTWIHRKTHLNIHLGIKKWVCKFCPKAFTNSCTLKGHEMLHTGERPHKCPECKKGFITVSAMKKHRMVHLKNSGSSNNCGKRDKLEGKAEGKTTSEQEINADFSYKYEQMFADEEPNYETLNDSKDRSIVGFIPIDNDLSC